MVRGWATPEMETGVLLFLLPLPGCPEEFWLQARTVPSASTDRLE